MHTRNTTKAEHIRPPHHFICLFLHRLRIPLPAKQALQAREDSSCPFFFPSSPPLLTGHRFSSKQGQTVAASAAVAFSKPRPPHYLPCPLCPSSLHLPVLQGCQDSKGANDTAPARYCEGVGSILTAKREEEEEKGACSCPSWAVWLPM